jgi:WD40 repeat protein
VTLGFLPFLKTPKITSSKWDEVILNGHQGEVTCSHFSTDGKIAITGSNDKQAIVWDTLNKTEKFKLKQHTASVTAVAISHDGSMALTGGDFLDNMIVLWDLKNGTKIRELKGHEHRIRGLRFLPDGKKAISGSIDCTARLWDLDTGKQIQFFEKMDTYDPKNLKFGSPNQVWHMDVSEDGKTMVCCMRDGRVCVHDVESGKRKNTLNGPDQFYKALSINQDASIAITAFGGQMLGMKDPYDLKIIRWNLASTSKEVLMETASLVETLHNPKGTNDLFIFPKKGQPFILDLKTKKNKNTLGHLDSLINCMSSVNDGSKIILGCKDFSVRLLNRE